jgi:hypothetical protein
MAEGLVSKKSTSLKKEKSGMYQSEDFLRVKKQLVDLGGGELLQDITMMIKYGMEVRSISRGNSETKTKNKPHNWELTQAGHDKEKRRRLQILSQPSTLLGAVNPSSIRAAERMKAIFEASSSNNAHNSTDHVKSLYDKTEASHIISTQNNKTEFNLAKEPNKLPKLRAERKKNKAGLTLLSDLDKSDDAERKKGKLDNSYDGPFEKLKKANSISDLSRGIPNLTLNPAQAGEKSKLTIPFIGDGNEDQNNQAKSSARLESKVESNPADPSVRSDLKVSKLVPHFKLSLKGRRNSESSLENPDPNATLRSPHIPTATNKLSNL